MRLISRNYLRTFSLKRKIRRSYKKKNVFCKIKQNLLSLYNARQLISGRFRQLYSTFLKNSEFRKHKKPTIHFFTFLNHQKTQNNSSFFRFSSCAVNLKKSCTFFFKIIRVLSSLSNLSSHVDFLEFIHICANREKVKFRNFLSFRMFQKSQKKSSYFLISPPRVVKFSRLWNKFEKFGFHVQHIHLQRFFSFFFFDVLKWNLILWQIYWIPDIKSLKLVCFMVENIRKRKYAASKLFFDNMAVFI